MKYYYFYIVFLYVHFAYAMEEKYYCVENEHVYVKFNNNFLLPVAFHFEKESADRISTHSAQSVRDELLQGSFSAQAPLTRKKGINKKKQQAARDAIRAPECQEIPSVNDYHIGYSALNLIVLSRYAKCRNALKEHEDNHTVPPQDKRDNFMSILYVIEMLQIMHHHDLVKLNATLNSTAQLLGKSISLPKNITNLSNDVTQYHNIVTQYDACIRAQKTYIAYKPLHFTQESSLLNVLLRLVLIHKSYENKIIQLAEPQCAKLKEEFENFKKSVTIPITRQTTEFTVTWPEKLETLMIKMSKSFVSIVLKAAKGGHPKEDLKTELDSTEEKSLQEQKGSVEKASQQVAIEEAYGMISEFLLTLDSFVQTLVIIPRSSEQSYKNFTSEADNRQKGCLTAEVSEKDEDTLSTHNKASQNQKSKKYIEEVISKKQSRKSSTPPPIQKISSIKKTGSSKNGIHQKDGMDEKDKGINDIESQATSSSTSNEGQDIQGGSVAPLSKKKSSQSIQNKLGKRRPPKTVNTSQKIDPTEKKRIERDTIRQIKNPIKRFYYMHKSRIHTGATVSIILILLLRIALKEGYLTLPIARLQMQT